MTKSISKQDLKKADQFTQTGRSLLEHIVKNQKMVLTVLILFVLGGVGFIVWDKTRYNKEIAVQEDYYLIEKKFLKIKEGFEKAEVEAKAEAEKKNAKSDKKNHNQLTSKENDKEKEDGAEESAAKEKSVPATGDLVKDYGPEVEGWTKLVEGHPQSKAAAMAALQLSQLYLKYEKPQEALQILLKAKNKQNSDHLLGAMVYNTYAKLLANQGQCQEAMEVWEMLEKKKSLHFLMEQAQLGRALCLDSLGQTDKAEGLFKDIVAAKSEPQKGTNPRTKTSTQKAAEKYLRYLKIKKNMVSPS